MKFCSSWNDPVYLQISDGFVFVDVSPLSLLKYTLFLSIPFHPPFFNSALQTRHYLRSMEMWKEFWGGFTGFIKLHKYAFMYCFLASYSTPAVYKQYRQADIFFSPFVTIADAKRGKWKPVCAIYIWVQGCVPACVFLLPLHTHTHLPSLLHVAVVTSADCWLLWCLHLSSIRPMLGIWPGLIVLTVTPASCRRPGRPDGGLHAMKEM